MGGKISKLGVVGAGVMGRGIAQTAALRGLAVVVQDVSADALATAETAVADSLARAVSRGRIDSAAAEAAKGRLSWTGALSGMADCDAVIEAAPERLEIKQAVMAQLEAALPPETPLATNTSSLSVAAIGAKLANSGRLAGLHFFNPVPAMALVELVAAPATEASVLDRLEALARALGKTPVRCADTPGFIVNRCARPFYGEALAQLEEGRAPLEIDAACRAADYPLGPFALIDLIGADVNLAATEGLSAAFEGSPRYHVFDALRAAVAEGRLGWKAGVGFVTPEPEAPATPPQDATEIVARIEAMLVNEAAALVADGAVTREAVDDAVKLGLNFPRGPFEILDAAGAPAVVARLDALEAAAPPSLLGRYEAVDALRGAADPLWARLAPPDRDPAYDNMGAIPDSLSYPPYWAGKAEVFRADAAIDTTRYGPHERHGVDVFRPADPAGALVVFIHGGYWKRLDKSFWSHLAAGPLAAGCAVAIPSYRLAPKVRLTEILADAHAAITAAAAAVPTAPIVLVGHSAGGQLVTRLLCEDVDWPADIRARFRGAVSISGLHDLRPLMAAPTHADLHLDLAEARALSPALHRPIQGLAHTLWVGGDELDAFDAQAELLARAWAPLGVDTPVRRDPGANHFTVLDGLLTPDAPLCRDVLAIALGEMPA